MVCISQMALQRKGKQRPIDSHAQSPKGHSSSLFAGSRPQRDQQLLNYTHHHTIKYANWRGTENPLDHYNCWFFFALFLVSLLLHISQEIYFVSFGLQSTSPSCSAACRYWEIPTFVRKQPEPKKTVEPIIAGLIFPKTVLCQNSHSQLHLSWQCPLSEKKILLVAELISFQVPLQPQPSSDSKQCWTVTVT